MASIFDILSGMSQEQNQTPIDWKRQGMLSQVSAQDSLAPGEEIVPENSLATPGFNPASSRNPNPGMLNQAQGQGILNNGQPQGGFFDGFGNKFANALLAGGSKNPGEMITKLQAADAEAAGNAKAKITQIPGTPYFQKTYSNGRMEVVDSTGRALTSTDGTDPLKAAMDKAKADEVALWQNKERFRGEIGVQSDIKKGAGKEQVKSAGDAASSQDAATELRRVAGALEQTPNATGPWIGLLPKTVRNIATPEGAALQDNAERVIQQSLRATLGAQFTEKEGARFLARAYDPQQNEAENARRLRQVAQELDNVQNNKEAALAWMKDKGTLDGFPGLNAAPKPAPAGGIDYSKAPPSWGPMDTNAYEYRVNNGILQRLKK